MILPDTSAWVEYLRRTESAVDLRLDELVRAGGPLAVTDPVEMEVLAGSRSDTLRREEQALLRSFTWLPFRTGDFAAATDVYRRCRSAGVTPRGLLDCMIAAVAMRHDVAVLTADRDLARIAEVMALRLDPASPR